MEVLQSFLIPISSTLFSLFLVCGLMKYSWTRRSKTITTTYNLPPGPPKLPLIGNMHQLFGGIPHRTLRDLAKKHGDLMHLKLGEINTIVVSSPRLAKEILKTHDHTLANRPKILVSEYLLYEGDIGFSPNGAHWRKMRKICAEGLLGTQNVRSHRSLREEQVWDLVESVKSKSMSSPEAVINLGRELYQLTSVITCKAAVGEKFKDQELLINLMQETTFLAGGFSLADVYPSVRMVQLFTSTKRKLLGMHEKIDRALNNIISERRERRLMCGEAATAKEDLLDGLLRRQKEEDDLQIPITDDNIKAVIFDMFTGSSETSSTTTEWCMAELIKNPRTMKKAQAELRQVLKGKQRIYESDIQELSYLRLVIKETLRLHPPSPLLLPRECNQPFEIDGYNIPNKTKVLVNAWAIGRDPESWEDPESFIPERFEDNFINFLGNNFEYIPFGAGRRICPGMIFGLANIELPLAQLLYHFDWKLPNGMKHQDLDMSDSYGAVSRMKNELCLVASTFIP